MANREDFESPKLRSLKFRGLDDLIGKAKASMESMAASTQPNELFTIDEREVHNPEWTREIIASLDDEISTWEQRAAQIPQELLALEREMLECQRDAAVARLKRMQMQARLDAMEGKR